MRIYLNTNLNLQESLTVWIEHKKGMERKWDIAQDKREKIGLIFPAKTFSNYRETF